MRAQIVHDRVAVAEEIEALILGEGTGADIVEIVGDYHSAKQCLTNTIYDILIIDLTIPFFKSDTKPNFKAVETLLKELFNHDTLHIPGDIIGITNDATALDMVGTSIGSHLMALIQEASNGYWREQLLDKIAYARRAWTTRYESAYQHYYLDALILTAMDNELEPYKSIYSLTEMRSFDRAKAFGFFDSEGELRRGVAFAVGRSGQPPAASYAQSLITLFRPRVALMSGYCGGVKTHADPRSQKIKLGDLAMFEASYAWDYGKWTVERNGDTGEFETVFRSRPNPIDIVGERSHGAARDLRNSEFNNDPELLAEMAALCEGRISKFDMHLCPAASGSAVVTNDDIVRQIRGLNDSILAVDMESYGFYQAAKHTAVARPQMLCIKAVSDFCNGEKGDELHAACSFISAKAVAQILQQWKF
jgi:nucleoside phosphorylase